jgi:glycogen synthase
MRMPENMEFVDIRKGSDVEFGQSIYEPFGISQLESLTFGGICVISDVCGCAGFLRDVTGGMDVKNVIVADYTSLRTQDYVDIEDMLRIDRRVRTRIEASVSEKVAMQICSRLPTSEFEIAEMVSTGYKLAQNMSWDVVVNNYLLGTLNRTGQKLRTS